MMPELTLNDTTTLISNVKESLFSNTCLPLHDRRNWRSASLACSVAVPLHRVNKGNCMANMCSLR
jgi:hypothetical protein